MGSIYSTARWQRLRLAHLSMHPMCEDCAAAGVTRAAIAVDHRKPISDGGDPFPAHDGLASLCTPCHSAKTARGVEAGAVRTRKPRKGCNPDGSPIDRRHPWFERGKSLRAGQQAPTVEARFELVSFSDEQLNDEVPF